MCCFRRHMTKIYEGWVRKGIISLAGFANDKRRYFLGRLYCEIFIYALH